jgi:peptidyl-prolyl isomerase D
MAVAELRIGLFLIAALSAIFVVTHMASVRDEAPEGLRTPHFRAPDGLRTPHPRANLSHAPVAAPDQCHARPNAEFDGNVAMWGESNLKPSAAACCDACRTHRAAATTAGRADGCVLWVWCARAEGCGTQPSGACWGKQHAPEKLLAGIPPVVRAHGADVPWTSGAVFTAAEADAVFAAERALVAAIEARRTRAGNPRVFFEIAIDGAPAGRIEFVLYAKEAPRHAENFRAMCTGELGGKKSFKGMRFYRIIDRFIDQAGVNGIDSIWDAPFDDDPGGLALRHDRNGLLSSANAGPDTNTGHFSIVVAPAPHLDGSYTIFGEVVAGLETVYAINKLSEPRKVDRLTGSAVVTTSGCLLHCAPLPVAGPKCARRSPDVEVTVQSRRMKLCLDAQLHARLSGVISI